MINVSYIHAKPPIRWAGGKKRLLQPICAVMPDFIHHKPFCLVEPFIGGGALSWHLKSTNPNLKHLIINDLNPDLINVYQNIKMNAGEMMTQLYLWQHQFRQLQDVQARKAYFLNKKQQYNARNTHLLTHACLFIFLNVTGFNGLYRVNSKNEYNLPMGSDPEKRQLFTESSFLALQSVLQSATVLQGDYSDTLQHIPTDMPCVFFLDPPYRKNFTNYTSQGFDDTDQEKLAEFCHHLHSLGHHFIATNSDTQDGYFEKLYYPHTVQRIPIQRNISADKNTRGVINELLIYNEIPSC